MTRLPALTVSEPPAEDSPDLTDAEVDRSIYTADTNELARLLTEEIRANRNFSLKRHELRRRGDHLYSRVTLVGHKEPDRVLVFQVNWLLGDDHVMQQSILEQLLD